MNWSDKITVFNEDCMDVMSHYPDGYFDLAIVDPPYGIGQDWKKSKKTYYHKESSYKNTSIPPVEYFQELFRVSKDQIIWGANYYSHILPLTNNLLVWDKRRNCTITFCSEGEMAWVSYSKWPFRIIEIPWDGARKGSETGIKKIHPHQKPKALYGWILDNYPPPSAKILDTHLGSGSHAIAAHYHKNCGEFIGAELDKDYYNDSFERFQQETKQLTLF